MAFSSENFGFSPPYAAMAGIGPDILCDETWNVFLCQPVAQFTLENLSMPGRVCFDIKHLMKLFHILWKG